MQFTKRGPLYVPDHRRQWIIPPSPRKSPSRYQEYHERWKRDQPRLAITFTQAANASTSASQATVAVTITSSAAGCALVVSGFTGSNHTVTGISDNVNGSTGWTQGVSAAASQGASRTSDIWYHLNPGAGITTVTVTFSVSDATNKEAVVMEFQGTMTFDTGNHLNDIASASTQTGASATPTTTSSAIISCLRTAGGSPSIHAGNAFTLPANGATTNGNSGAYLITTSTSAQAAVWDLGVAGASCSSIVVLKGTVSSGGGGPVCHGGSLTKGALIRGGRIAA